MSTLLEIEDLTVGYRQGANVLRPGASVWREVVRSVSLEVRPRQIVGLVGESGSGKTTVARAVLGLAPVAGGAVRFLGEDLVGHRGWCRNDPRIQMVFQDPLHSLDPSMRVRSALSEPLRVSKVVPAAQIDHVCRQLMTQMDLDPSLLERFPHELSGGQRQRIGLARALSTNPRLIVADECTSALDVTVQAQVLNLMMDLRADLDVSLLFISHNLGVIRHVADHVAVMRDGEIVEQGPAEEVFTDPRHPYTHTLLDSVPALG